MKDIWIKVVEYASMPHLGLSRKIRPGYAIEFNGDGRPLSGDVVFEIYDTYLRVISEEHGEPANTYYDWEKLASVKTVGSPRKK
ncbi:hypothetical protein dsat_1634 [Alkalidesulfovibrio alkalitolerans DSM 16529]|uniref:Uncharacterized protein n=1 Tax=Alkalidesulfovibrio alkalitolerans DSM 16529 TaxID=1121439 RepID=S7TH17_9BACT|nr:hypothetical protein [Alkalidesulfovibrio alkalitolerans]EPR36106.1 hypothetical protein dsat_1634 [Alkalidesulfovibrio alkalitolerans DSM 16529]